MSAALDIVIGLVVVYLVFSIVVSGLQEWWSQFRGQRGLFLRIGMKRLIGDEAIFIRVLQHPLVGNLYRDRAARGKPPSYVDPANFALAFADVALRRAGTPAGQPMDFVSLRAALAQLGLQHSPAALSVLPILDRSQGDLDVALKGIEQWFAGGMDRVSGWYKGYAQRRLFTWGLVLAILCNVDSIAIFHALNASPALRAALGDQARSIVDSGQVAGVDIQSLQGRGATGAETAAVLDHVVAAPLASLPIGYTCLATLAVAVPRDAQEPAIDEVRASATRCIADWKAQWRAVPASGVVLHVIGWLITAFAGVLGAPYWFGLLSKVVNIRGAGPKPKEPAP